jgi:hypothetical protein
MLKQFWFLKIKPQNSNRNTFKYKKSIQCKWQITRRQTVQLQKHNYFQAHKKAIKSLKIIQI